jgi:outer membrane protein assembly factor BamB
LVWTFDKSGLGFSGPAIVGDRLYTMGARQKKGEWLSHLIALDISGKEPKELWACPAGPMYRDDNNVWGDGPRSTPTVDGDFVYALSGMGELVCVAVKNGDLVWKKNLASDLGGELMTYWGYCESVLIDGDQLICTPGGAKGILAALNKKTGAVLWRSKELKDKATYSSVMAADLGGANVKQYVVMTVIDDVDGGTVAGVAAKDGKLVWQAPHFTGSSYAVCTTPLIKGDDVYITAGYGAGCKLLRITKVAGKFVVDERYKEKQEKVMKNTHGGVVLLDGRVYGHSEGLGFVCQNWKTGQLVWNEKSKLDGKSAAVMAAEGHLYVYGEEGECVLLNASSQGWDEQGRFTVPEKTKIPEMLTKDFKAAKFWAHPVVANGKLYLREQEYLYCYDIRAKK